MDDDEFKIKEDVKGSPSKLLEAVERSMLVDDAMISIDSLIGALFQLRAYIKTDDSFIEDISERLDELTGTMDSLIKMMISKNTKKKVKR
jgi:hypothetical protein